MSFSSSVSDTPSYETLNDTKMLLDFFQLDEAQCRAIRSMRDVIDQALPTALDKFYDQARKTPQTRSFFSSEQHIQHARTAQIAHWKNISNADFGEDYNKRVRAIGTVHARIGLEPRWYLGGYAIILDSLIRSALEKAAPRRGLFGKGVDETFSAGLAGLCKAVLLDIDLAISVYLEELEKEREKARAEVQARQSSQEALIENLKAGLLALSKGDLGFRFENSFEPEFEELRENFNAAANALSSALGQVSGAVTHLETGVDEIAIAAEDLARRTERQAANLSHAAASVRTVSTGVEQTAQITLAASKAASSARDAGHKSNTVTQEAIAAMRDIAASSEKMSSIVDLIDEISFQTNILSLNAGVEAARAGEAGRGFAVVATEVRVLAERSAQSAKEIRKLISSAGQQVNHGVRLVGNASDTLADMSRQVEDIADFVSRVSNLAQEQVSNLNEINRSVAEIDQTTQQNAAMVEQSSAATHTLRTETQTLTRTISHFRLAERSANLPAQLGNTKPRPYTRPGLIVNNG
ncbi:globin-coupled sensor protein [Acetobacter suratthaniensis]|uniref:Globin-coupled sensor protein n=1 Tax=Acetobacter suratthaniensis TaxID=1502841 RepID=A0ABS3LPA0_9PROT|nr:globin-coupled sensor protein [Acetobacter suratthaniensis]MBO1329188.1 globin-coupled sensor protein [Acetobacter suratthaniensis]MCX2567255.1 globin-coupled sensor protein [Acetobacter suratthaniensis]